MNLKDCPTPILGFCAFSGTGKTTLLTKLIPLFAAQNLRLAIVKHAHHDFDIDHPQKDSYKLRHAGATQMLISSSRRWALMRELSTAESELSLSELLNQIDHEHVDLILVEGFKKETFNKIELHRPGLGHPVIYPTDPNVIAMASNEAMDLSRPLPLLDINNPEQIASFIIRYLALS